MPPCPIQPDELRAVLSPDGWLGTGVGGSLRAATAALPDPDPGDLAAFFAGRGLGGVQTDADQRSLAGELVAIDRRLLAHALGMMLSDRADDLAGRFLPAEIARIVGDDPPRLDHVGGEVFGRLEWQLQALADLQARGLVKLQGHRIFPSVQVRRVLAHDRQPADVRVARVYLDDGRRLRNVEFFEVSQGWLRTVARQLSLYADLRPAAAEALAEKLAGAVEVPVDPIGHVALTVAHPRTVHRVRDALARARPDGSAARLYDGDPTVNAGDQSINVKFLARTGTLAGRPVFGRIVELICYGGSRVSAGRPATASGR